MKLPDLGEGTVSAEVVAWKVAVGDLVVEDQPLAEMATEKAVVEVPSPVTGRVVALAGVPGDSIAVGAELVVFERGDPVVGAGAGGQAAPPAPLPEERPAARVAPAGVAAARVKASPATRRRAREAGVELATLAGSGPGGRILRADLDAALAGESRRSRDAVPVASPGGGVAGNEVAAAIDAIPVIGVRRVIAQRMAEAVREAPHFSYVEEVDVTELEALRAHLNARLPAGAAPLTYLPFVVAALARVLLREHPQCNAHYDAARNLLLRHRAVHAGIATQTRDGLKVPVVRHAERLSLWELAAAIRSAADAARSGQARREDLSGSTVTVTSLGRLGGIASTPILNLPEVAIVGVNKASERVVVHDGKMAIRRMMNLSSSFDHRFVDGFDAAAMIQSLKTRLEHPATIFID
jgi:2-oxoisovalerate dehydrogenase E2 component (dihydrolipoyl transacylase)